VALEALGMNCTDEEVAALFSSFDINGDSKLQFEEYALLIQEAAGKVSGRDAMTNTLKLDDNYAEVWRSVNDDSLEIWGSNSADTTTSSFVRCMGDSFANTTASASAFNSSSQLMPQHLAKARKVFDAIDTNDSGEIDAGELKVALETLGMRITDDEVDDLFKSLDINADSKLHFEEYMEFMNETAARISARNTIPEGDVLVDHTILMHETTATWHSHETTATWQSDSSIEIVVEQPRAPPLEVATDITGPSSSADDRGEPQQSLAWRLCDAAGLDATQELTEIQADNVQRVFDAIDLNESGLIDADEFRLAVEALGMNISDEVEVVFKSFDINGDSDLRFDEYVKLVQEAVRET